MLVLKTTFHLRQDLPWNVVYETCIYQWIANSINRETNVPHYQKLLGQLPKSIDFGPEEERKYESESESLLISVFKYNDTEYLGFTFVYYNANRKWDLRTVLKRTEQNVICGVSLSCEVIKNEGIPNIYKPKIIDYLLKHQAGDGGIEISDRAHILKNADYTEALNLLSGKTKNKLPYVYLSSAGENHALRPSRVARQLYGIAHVYAEEDAHLSARLQLDLKTYFPTKGEIGICYPTHPMIIVNRGTDSTWQESPEVLVQDIFKKLLRQSIASKSEFSWDDFQKAQVKHYQERIKKANSDEGQNQELLDKISELQANIGELRVQLKAAEEERDTYLNMADEYEKDCNNARGLYRQEVNSRVAAEAALTQYKNMNGANIALNSPKDPEKYDGESMAAIVCALKQVLKGLDHKKTPRYYDICQGILDANPEAESTYNSIQEKMKAILDIAEDQNLKSGKGKQALSKLNMIHDADNGKNHGQIMFPDDDRYIAVEPSTGSDFRGGKNEAALIRNLFFFKES